jgi:hypothetical protein
MKPGLEDWKIMVIKEYFQYIVPYIFITYLFLRIISFKTNLVAKQTYYKLGIMLFSALITFYPFTGLSLADYLLSLNPNYSIGSLGLFVMLLGNQLSRKPLVATRHLWEFSLWNVAFSLCLYLSYLGFIAYDMYFLGYTFSAGFLAVAFFTLILIWRHSPLSYIFISYIAAFNLQLLPSPNFFDYITDGLLFVTSLVMLGYYSINYRQLRLPSGAAAEGPVK